MTWLLAILIAAPARALTADHEKLDILGWNRQCSIAFARYVYPKVGEALQDEPIETRVGTLTIESDEQLAKERLLLSLTGAGTWDQDENRKLRARLAKEDYRHPGFVEKLRQAPVVDQRDLPRLIESTDTYKSSTTKWLPPPWRPSSVNYAPFASECAMMLYTLGDKPFYKVILFRVGNPTIRNDRADAHVTNGLLLLEAGNSEGALAEEEVAAAMAPEFAPARYQYAALLTLNGRFEPAIDELAAAVKLDSRCGPKARGDRNFDGLRWHPRFDALTK